MNNTKGVTLVELMIALALSTILGIALVQLYAKQKVTATELSRENRLNQELRFANQELKRWLSLIGYSALPQNSRALAFPALAATTNCPAMPAGVVITADLAKSAATPGICIRFQRTFNEQRDCLGSSITTASVVNRLFLDPANFQIKCTSQDQTGVIAENISDLNFLFLLSDTSNKHITQKISISNIASADYSRIKAIEIALLGRSANSHPSAPDYNFPPDTETKITPPDKHYYSSTSTTFSLNNVSL
ncbi:PilW family protein [Pelagibaculum spongiae]|uniref:Prepilin-type N-terminal cleavage/methylation domain-containing protein n=1 Tax=Pelagibaculum spongiae TaxID=2080658 RepID=A0A2V1H5M2_9GAMM|nr:PilW family protein [Pelagibaculum spongiae]PVZ72558.1 hypothetical protein DC094_00450 [Pelagibaculum spongiae]